MSNPTNNNGEGTSWQSGGSYTNDAPGGSPTQPLPPYQQGQSSSPYSDGSTQQMPTYQGQSQSTQGQYSQQGQYPQQGQYSQQGQYPQQGQYSQQGQYPQQGQTYGQGSQPYGHEQTTFAPQAAQPVHGQPLNTQPPGGLPPQHGGTAAGKRKFPWWGWLIAGLLALALILGLIFGLTKKKDDTPTTAPTTAVATAPASSASSSSSASASASRSASASASRSASASASASRSASASATANASGKPTSIADLDKIAAAAGVKCDQWTTQNSSGIDLKICTQGQDTKFLEMYSPSLPMNDSFWKGFGSTYSDSGSYVVTDKNGFGYVTGSNKDVADKIAKATNTKVYKITSDGLADV